MLTNIITLSCVNDLRQFIEPQPEANSRKMYMEGVANQRSSSGECEEGESGKSDERKRLLRSSVEVVILRKSPEDAFDIVLWLFKP